MKRCPQCEFIYEDDQSCCDMDGIDLVFEHATPSAALQKISPTGKRKTSRRSLLSVCAVLFGVLFLAIAYASLERAMTASSEPASLAASSSAEPAKKESDALPVEPAPVEPAEEKPTVSPEAEKKSGKEPVRRSGVEPGLTPEPLQRNSLGTRGVVLGSIPQQNRVEASRTQPTIVRVRPTNAPAKKDSKVVSIVKKTGRLLTKPFKL